MWRRRRTRTSSETLPHLRMAASSPVTQGLKVIASIQVKDDKRGEGGRRHTRSVGLFTLKTDCVIKIAPDRLLQPSWTFFEILRLFDEFPI